MEVRSDQLPAGAGSSKEVPLRDAASVIVLRGDPFEVLFMQRNEKSTFVPGSWVFPGGTVDDVDRECAALIDDDILTLMRLCAIRELLEETGVWIGDSIENVADTRRDLLEDPAKFKEIASSARTAIDRLVWHARWITPVGVPKRFDTWFFVVQVDESTKATPEHQEGVEIAWVAPADALARNAEGGFPLVFPTIKNLEALSAFRSAEDLIEDRRNATIETTRPVLIVENGKMRIVLPGES